MKVNVGSPGTDIRGKAALESRSRILSVIFTIVLFAVVVRIFSLQIFGYQFYQNKVINEITAGSALKAPRGEIYDRNGVCLATNKTVYRIYISPVDIAAGNKRDKTDYGALIAKELSSLLSLSYDTLYQKTQKTSHMDETVKKNVSETEKNAVLAFAEKNGLLSMIHAEATLTRYYPMGSFASHVIGFAGSDSQGLFGLEAYYNDLLTGQDGQYVTARDATSKVLENGYAGYIPAVPGQSIVTTLDSYLQRELELQLSAALLNADAKNRVTGIVMNVQNGEILAMATLPSYDLNDPYTLDSQSAEELEKSGYAPGSDEYKSMRNQLLYEMWNNKAVSELYEPGSTFKIVTAATGLELAVVSPTDPFTCTGSYRVGGYNISCHKRGGHGHLTFAEGLQHSCNPVMMQIAERIGSERFYAFFTAFGYRQKTGIDLPSEAMGIFHKPEALGTTELATASFGQRFKVTPIQQLTAIAEVANGGHTVTPHLFQYATDTDGKVTQTYASPNATRTILSAETCHTLWSILEAGVSGGAGAKNAYVAGYKIAAKTGTSEKFDILDQNGNSYLRIGSCVAFAPADEPEIAMILIVDEPTCDNKYGSMTAAPYVARFLQNALPYLGYVPSYQDSEKTVKVGDYVGKTVSEVKKELQALGLSCTVSGSGKTILSQVPSPGTSLYTELGKVLLYTEGAEENTEVTVPKLVGKTAKEANEILTSLGLNVRFTGAINDSLGQGATVTTQSIPAGTTTKKGSLIELFVLYTDDTD